MTNEFLSRHLSHMIAVIKRVHVNGNSASPMTQDLWHIICIDQNDSHRREMSSF